MHVHAARTQDGAGAGEQNGAGGLEEEEGLLGPGAVELFDVFAADISVEYWRINATNCVKKRKTKTSGEEEVDSDVRGPRKSTR